MSSWIKCNMVATYESGITSCDTGSFLWVKYLHSAPSWDKKNWEKGIGSLGKFDLSPDSKAYLTLLDRSLCLWAVINSWRLRFWTTGISSLTAPTGTLRDKTSATTLARPGTYLKVGGNSCIVRYHLVSLQLKFRPLLRNNSVTAAWSVNTVTGYPKITSR